MMHAWPLDASPGLYKNTDDHVPLPDVIESSDVPSVELAAAKEDANETTTATASLAIPEHSHPGESNTNRLAERAVQTFEDQLRTLKHALETHLKTHIANDDPIMAWLVEHTSWALNEYVLGSDGCTAYSRLHGKDTRERICEFAEVVLWYVPVRLRGKLGVRWRYGLFI